MKTTLRPLATSLLLLWLAAPLVALAEGPPTPAPELPARAWVLRDFATGQILTAKEANAPVEPASLTKVMTAWVVFDALERGEIKGEDLVTVSERAWRTGGSRMFIEVGSRVSVDDLLSGLVVQSGNDAAVALSEAVGGTEAAFATRMNTAAATLGLHGSHFENATGLPAAGHLTTATDLVTLGEALIRRFPTRYALFAEKTFTWNGITQPNRNRLLHTDPSADGLKTGHTESAGYCLLASAERDNMRLVVSLLGAQSDSQRFEAAAQLLEWGFGHYANAPVLPAGGAVIWVPVFKAEVEEIALGVEQALVVTVPRGREGDVKTVVQLNRPAVAPLERGAQLGTVEARLGDQTLATRPLVALTQVPAGGWIDQLWGGLRLWAVEDDAPKAR